jgi:Pyruvate/2-oxoacid:ferredoxin oxidoreductase delta subunit
VVSDRTSVLPCDHVLLALGQSADESLLPEGWKLEDGRISAPDREVVAFAAGDLSTSDGTVTHAIGDGRRAAGRALVELGEHVHVFELTKRAKAVRPTDIRLGHFPRSHAHKGDSEPGEERIHTMDEVNHGLADLSEADRCCSCGHCTKCDTCLVYCPEGIISRTADGYEIDLEYCKGCGICVVECPRSGMEMISQ